MGDLGFETASGLADAIREKTVSSREVTAHFLSRIERFNPRINAIVTLNPAALDEAAAADERLARGAPAGPLNGVPVTVKDTYETAGLRTTAGARDLAHHVPARDAEAVARLRAAGAVLLGKTNTPAYAGDIQTCNRLFGTTNNPWDLSRSPGGSSGGAAAALAAGLTALELGSDVGGSIRTPSSWSGVFGHKPSFGLVPAAGHLSGPPGVDEDVDIAVYGPMARSVHDLSIALAVLSSLDLSARPPRCQDLRSYRVAAWLDESGFSTDESLLAALTAAVDTLRGAGVEVDDDARPDFPFRDAARTFETLMFSGLSAALPQKVFGSLNEKARALLPEDGSPQARFLLGSTLSHREWLNMNQKRRFLREAWNRFFGRFDVLLCPVTFVPAIPHLQEKGITDRTVTVNGKTRPYLDLFSWAGVIGVSYLPSTVVPVGLTSEGLPAGIQIVGNYLEDATTLDFAEHLSRLTGGFAAPPGYGG